MLSILEGFSESTYQNNLFFLAVQAPRIFECHRMGCNPKQFYGPLFSIKCHPRHISIGSPSATAGPFVAISLAIMRVRLQNAVLNAMPSPGSLNLAQRSRIECSSSSSCHFSCHCVTSSSASSFSPAFA